MTLAAVEKRELSGLEIDFSRPITYLYEAFHSLFGDNRDQWPAVTFIYSPGRVVDPSTGKLKIQPKFYKRAKLDKPLAYQLLKLARQPGHEVFFCPVQMTEDGIPSGAKAGESRLVYADLDDHGITPEQWAWLRAHNATIIDSGGVAQDGQPKAHIYLRAVPHQPGENKVLNTHLRDLLGADDKQSPATFLRLPGTWHRKDQSERGGKFCSVRQSYARRYALSVPELAQALRTDAESVRAQSRVGGDLETPTERVSVSHEERGPRVRKTLRDFNSMFRQGMHKTRYGLVMGLVKDCIRQGLTIDQTWGVVDELEAAQDKAEDEGTSVRQQVTTAWNSAPAHKVRAELAQEKRNEEAERTQPERERAGKRLAGRLKGMDLDDPERKLRFRRFGEVAADVDKRPKPEFLFAGVIVEGDYGILSAQDKAGKTWTAEDAAVSCAAGLPWMGVYECPVPGPVILFLGEGSDRKAVRRIRAIATHKGLSREQTDALPIVLCCQAPNLTDGEQLEEIGETLAVVRPRLVILDPLYLSAGNAKGSDLYSMGAMLGSIQHVVQDAKSSLLVTHHWKKTGDGNGHDRTSGVGPGAWGRFLISMGVDSRQVDRETGESTVVLNWLFEGDEISQPETKFIRRVREEERGNLASPMHYDVEKVDKDGNGAGSSTPSAASGGAGVIGVKDDAETRKAAILALITERGEGDGEHGGWVSTEEIEATFPNIPKASRGRYLLALEKAGEITSTKRKGSNQNWYRVSEAA